MCIAPSIWTDGDYFSPARPDAPAEREGPEEVRARVGACIYKKSSVDVYRHVSPPPIPHTHTPISLVIYTYKHPHP